MLEKMYEDFVNNVLPKVQEGLVITKDYFFDLFGRYVKYLIIIDSVWLFFSFLFVVIGLFCVKKIHETVKDDSYNNGAQWLALFIVLSLGFAFIMTNATDLVKDLTIPEVRVYEEIQQFKR